MRGVAIGLDLGTSGVRAALVRPDGDPIARASAAITAAYRRDPAAWWSATKTALETLARDASLGEVRRVAVCGTSGTILPVGANGTALAPASLYNDAADPAAVARIAAIAPATSAAHGGTSPLARALAWRGLPDLVGILHEADWLTGRLRGQFGDSDWNNALKTGFDPVALRWPDWMSHLDLSVGLLPTPKAPGTRLGRIDPRAAADLGLPSATEIVAGTTDGCAAFLATGATDRGDGVTSLGTTLTLKLLSDRPVFAPEYGVYSHRIGDLWLAGGASNSGGGALARYFTPAQITTLSDRIDAERPSPLDYYPLPTTGERFPIADATLAPRETPRPEDDAAFLHGLLEGIATIEALGYRRLADLGAPKLARVFTVGGGSRNAAWTRIRARILGMEPRAPRSREAAVGVARLALQAMP